MAWVREESYKKTFQCHGSDIVAEINRAGELTLHGYDPIFEQALIEFGEEKTTCYQIYRGWAALPAEMIISYFDITSVVLVKFIIDCAEHVSWMLSTERVYGWNAKFKQEALGLARELISKQEFFYRRGRGVTEKERLELSDLRAAVSLKQKSFPLTGIGPAGFVATALSSALKLSLEMAGSLGSGFSYTPKEIAIDVVSDADEAYSMKHDKKSRGLRERVWQVRRFIDVMSAIEHNQPWPPLKWTK